MAPGTSERTKEDFNDFLTLNVRTYLAKIDGVCDTQFSPRNGCDSSSISQFEKMHGICFPEDLKQFYLSTNGLEFNWKFKIAGAAYPVGKMYINSISELCLYTEKVVSGEMENLENGGLKMFSLDSSPSNGIVIICLSSGSMNGHVYFVDINGKMQILATNFQRYFRQMIVHLGLPEWQALRTFSKISVWAQQLYHLFGPHLLQPSQDNVNLNEKIVVCNSFDKNIFKTRK